MTKNALLIFTRNPELGKVKTRLAKTVGDQTALNIYHFLLERTQEITHPVKASKFVFYSETIRQNDLWNTSEHSKELQIGEHLGIRMKNAFANAFAKGYEKVIIIGSDMYDMTSGHIEEAFKNLENNEVVIGPAEDGGYYLLGLRQLIPEIFEDKDWGTSSVLKETLAQLNNYDIHKLEELNDVDVFEDIEKHPAFKSFLKPTN